MPSPFAALADLARRQTTRLSGEPAEFRPMTRPAGPNGAAVADGAREALPIVAIFAENADEVFDSARVASFAATSSAGSRLTATFDVGGLEIRAGIDRVARLGTGDVFVVTERQSDGMGGVTCRLAVVVE